MKINLKFFAIISLFIRSFQRLPLRWKEVVMLVTVMAIVLTWSLSTLYAFAGVIIFFIWNRFHPGGFSDLRCIHPTGVVPSFLNMVKA